MKGSIMKYLLVILGLIGTTMAPACADDQTDIRTVLQKYLDGTSQGKPELIREAFKDTMEIQWLDEKGDFRRRKGPDYIKLFKAGVKIPRVGKIINIDMTNGNAAGAKIEIRWNGKLYTDYVLLMKINGDWKITNKIATWVTE